MPFKSLLLIKKWDQILKIKHKKLYTNYLKQKKKGKMPLRKTVFHLTSILSKFKNFAEQIKRRNSENPKKEYGRKVEN